MYFFLNCSLMNSHISLLSSLDKIYIFFLYWIQTPPLLLSHGPIFFLLTFFHSLPFPRSGFICKILRKLVSWLLSLTLLLLPLHPRFPTLLTSSLPLLFFPSLVYSFSFLSFFALSSLVLSSSPSFFLLSTSLVILSVLELFITFSVSFDCMTMTVTGVLLLCHAL